MNRYFSEPYVFIPPYRSRFWLRLVRPYVPLHRRLVLGLRRLEARGVAHLRDSLDRGAGMLLAPNHWCMADGLVVGSLALQAGKYCHYLVSNHIFRRGRFHAWMIRRLGCFSVLREGTDREALRAGAQILAEAQRPLVVFAEGTWYRQNDRLGPLQQGAALIAHLAARHTQRPVVAHPVAIKYWLLADPRPALRRRLDTLERHLGCSPGGPRGLVGRVEAVTAAWLASQERAYLGRGLTGDADDRRGRLLGELLAQLEEREYGQLSAGDAMDRVRRLRGVSARRLTSGANAPGATAAAKRLEVLMLCECLYGHSLAYLRDRPSWERVAETVQRLAETVWDEFERPVAPMGVVVEAGAAVDVRADAGPRAGAPDPREALTACLAERVQRQLDRLAAEGPPAAWKVPAGAWGDPHAP